MGSVIIQTDRIVIVGAGLGGLYAALGLAPRPVLMISPETLGTGASSAWAQGGVAAAIEAPDSPAAHARDTVRAGAGTVDAQVADRVTRAAAEHIGGLSALGTPFDRDAQGHYVLSREAAHSMARVVRVQGDQAGQRIMRTLIDTVRATPSIQVIEGAMATTLEVRDRAVTGVRVQSSADGGSEDGGAPGADGPPGRDNGTAADDATNNGTDADDATNNSTDEDRPVDDGNDAGDTAGDRGNGSDGGDGAPPGDDPSQPGGDADRGDGSSQPGGDADRGGETDAGEGSDAADAVAALAARLTEPLTDGGDFLGRVAGIDG